MSLKTYRDSGDIGDKTNSRVICCEVTIIVNDDDVVDSRQPCTLFLNCSIQFWSFSDHLKGKLLNHEIKIWVVISKIIVN